MTDPVRGYDEGAAELLDGYERLRPEDVHAGLLDLLPPGQDRLVLDVGAGSGRDAAWLRRLGYEVVAVEPARRMREGAQARHPDPVIRWVDSSPSRFSFSISRTRRIVILSVGIGLSPKGSDPSAHEDLLPPIRVAASSRNGVAG